MDMNKIITKNDWMNICRKYNRWCLYEEVKGMTIRVAVIYITTMPYFDVM